jgi:hypothetical protein
METYTQFRTRMEQLAETARQVGPKRFLELREGDDLIETAHAFRHAFNVPLTEELLRAAGY